MHVVVAHAWQLRQGDGGDCQALFGVSNVVITEAGTGIQRVVLLELVVSRHLGASVCESYELHVFMQAHCTAA